VSEPIAVYLAGGQNDRVLKVMYPPFMSDPRFNTIGVSNNWNDLTARYLPGAAEILVIEADIAPDPDTLMRFLNTLPSPAIVILPGNASALEGKMRNIQATVRDVYVGPAVNYQEVARKAHDIVVTERSLRQFAEPTRGLIGGGPRTATIVGTRIIAVWGKGGSGKSTLATNLAWELARRGLRTVAIGLDVPDALVAYLNIDKIQTTSMAFFQRPNLEGFRASLTRKDNLDVVISPNDILIAEEMARRPSDDPGSIKSLVMTAANASLKVASCLQYQRVSRRGKRCGCKVFAINTTRLNRPNRQGVVRSIARSDHWRWVSKPSCARISANRTSMFQRFTNQPMICSAVAVGSEQK